MNYIVLILFLLMPVVCGADVYIQKNPNGGIIFSDTPMSNSATVLPDTEIQSESPVTTTSTPETTQNTAPNAGPGTVILKQEKKPYTNFTITSPADQGSIQNQPTLVVDLSVDPPLQEGDTIQLFLDGTPLAMAQANTHFEVTIPDRGTHTLSAAIIDAQGTVLKNSNTITIYVHQVHL